ncbi:MAG: hypothetical protein AB7T15_01125 [Desulfuromonas sp.]|nr:hypothetical protein [Desulfuromonas thiophila]
MTALVVAGCILLVLLLYVVSALAPLAWYLYLPFVVLFLLVLFWKPLTASLPWKSSFGRGGVFRQSRLNWPGRGNGRGRRRNPAPRQGSGRRM